MRVKELFGSTVLDKNVAEVGKIEDIDVDVETGKVVSIVVSLKKGILSNDSVEIDFEDISTIGDYVLLSTEISSQEDEEEVTIEVESD